MTPPPNPFAPTQAIRLRGDWLVQPQPLSASVPEAAAPTIRVPECAHLQTTLYPDQPYWGERLRALNEQAWLYRRVFPAPDADAGWQRARLRFEGVDYYAEVWLNGTYLGRHEGSFAPFEFDVTRLLAPGDNELIVRVSSPWDAPNPSGTYPTDHVIRGLVKGLYEHGEGVIPPDVNPLGVWRPVWLLLDAGVSLDHIRIRTTLAGRVDLHLRLTNATDAAWSGSLDLAVTADNHDGRGADARLPMTLPPGVHELDAALTIPEPRLWWPWDQGAPNLYRLTARLLDTDDAVTAETQECFGVRTVRLERSPERFTYWINERAVFVRGTAYMPALYLSACSAASLARDLELARAANLNLLRVHVHVTPPELYDLCDRAGMLVWQDFELNWVHDPSPEFEQRARDLQRAMITLLENHPAIITWTCHNEPTMVFVRRQNLETRPDPALYADAQAQDPTRPVFLCSGQMESDWQRCGDVHSYYGALWSKHYTDAYRQQPRLNTEFGVETPAALDTLRHYPEVWTRLAHLDGQIADLWAYQAALIQYQVEHFRRLRAAGSAGYVHFWLTDLVPQVGCGVLDAFRVPKGGYAALQRASQPLHVMLEHNGRRPLALWVCNDTPNAYPGAQVGWRVEDSAGRLLLEGQAGCDVAANAAELVERVAWAVAPADCACIRLTLTAADGALLCANAYEQPFAPLPRPRGYPWKFDRYLGTKVFDRPGAPSLADQSASPLVKVVPLAVREAFAEWILRQRLPTRWVSAIARVGDRLLK